MLAHVTIHAADRTDGPELAQFVGPAGWASLVAGKPTEHVHMGQPAAEDAPPPSDPDGNRVELLAR